jgi:hypothetical protein
MSQDLLISPVHGDGSAMGSESVGLLTESGQEQDDQGKAGREAGRLEAELRRRESEVVHLERRINSSKENLRWLYHTETGQYYLILVARRSGICR